MSLHTKHLIFRHLKLKQVRLSAKQSQSECQHVASQCFTAIPPSSGTKAQV